YFGTQAAPYAAQLQSDDAGADDTKLLRHALEIERAPVVDDVLAVELHARQFGGNRPRGQHHVLRGQRFLLAVVRGEFDFPTRQQPAVALKRGDAGARLDDAGLALLHLRDVEGDATDIDAVHAELVFRLVIQLRGFEQRLRRDAARIGAGAAEDGRAVLVLPFVDAGHLQLVLRRANGGGITRRTATDDDHVVFVRHEILLLNAQQQPRRIFQ